MYKISNINKIPRDYIDDPDFQTQLKTLLIGDVLGCEKIYVNIDYVKPGAKSTKYHSHTRQEEFFLIMSGKGILRINGEEISVVAGDVISKPAGKDIAHQFINNGSEILQILDMGNRDKEDIAVYPDENKVFLRNKKLVFDLDDTVKNWSSDPNE
ncbi:cupin domain-containing protein [Anaerocolumna sp. MB42-C2]|uniref:cupin domain-containing protein n=1 Tax=Anaerocolumna sp. MB42-C2 TaxID=3070997 RepID=UPI0027DEE9E3|nr:cupin domain-containing protein [Anaerocolumna sp. MB42-C2]WMJ90093.1 cupin domain-containing protein [Anaerocolumna sp. MB42-C2]